MKKTMMSFMAGALFLSGTTLWAQQQITLSWISKKAEGAPISVNGATHVTIVITGVNDFLYTYEGFITAAPVGLPVLGGGGSGSGNKFAPPCSQADLIQRIKDGWDKNWQVNPLLDKGNKAISAPNSVSVETTAEFYKQNIEPLYKQIDRGHVDGCSDWPKLLEIYNKWEQRLASPHVYTMDVTLEPLNNYTIHLSEYYASANSQSQLTNACTQNSAPAECTIEYQPQNDILTISGGYLMSELQARSYDRANIPGSTDAVLNVGGTGRINSVLAALVNVKLPCPWGSGKGKFVPPCSPSSDEAGWALSVGPVLQLGGSGQTTKAGLFGGISLHFWKYVYLTPGLHVGNFADFPAGFTKVGQDIPAAFTSPLTPQTRTSARFGLAITFKGFKIGGSKGQSQLQGTNHTAQ